MKSFVRYGLYPVLLQVWLLQACGGSSSCTTDENGNTSCSTAEGDPSGATTVKLGDSCSTEGKWSLVALTGSSSKVAARCRQGIIGQDSEDRLSCQRLGYSPSFDSNKSYAYCTNAEGFLSFRYDEEFGTYNPARCPVGSAPRTGRAASNQLVTLSCVDGYYQKLGSTQQESFNPDPKNTSPSMCPAKLQKGINLSLLTADYQPAPDDEPDAFTPPPSCKDGSNGKGTLPDNVAGSSLRD